MKRLLMLFYCCIFILPGLAVAEDQEAHERDAVIMDEVVVTATKTEEKRRDIANSVIIIDKLDIQESPAETLGELLANELGIDWRTYGDYGGAAQEIQIRGLNGDGTQVFVNGINVNSPSLAVADIGKIPLNSVDKIEVVKGSGSLLYGTGAAGGTINIITKRAQKGRTDFKTNAGYGHNNSYLLSVENGMFLNDYFGYFITASRKETDGFRDNGDMTQNDCSLNILYDSDSSTVLSFYADYMDRYYGMPGVKPPLGTKDFSYNGVTLYNTESANLLARGSDKDGHLAINLESSPWANTKLRFNANYTNMENYNYNRYYSTWPTVGLPGSKTWVINKIFGMEGNADLELSDNLKFLVGGEYKDYNWENETIDLNNKGADVSSTASNAVAGLYSNGIYAEAQYRPCDYFKGIAGLRKEKHSTFGTEYIPRYGVIINPSSDTTIKFSHGKHYKSPTPNDLFWPREDWGFGMGAEGNKALQPETGWHSDATIEQSMMNKKLFLTLSYFEWDLKNKIRWIPDAAFFYTPQNLNKYDASGWEAGIKIGPIKDLDVSLSYTMLDATEHVVDGASRRALYTPDNQFKADLSYWSCFDLFTMVTVRYVSERAGSYANDNDAEPSKILESYWTADIKIEKSINANWVITLSGKNLFDKEYYTYASTFRNQSTGVTTTEGYPGSGRSAFINLTYEY